MWDPKVLSTEVCLKSVMDLKTSIPFRLRQLVHDPVLGLPQILNRFLKLKAEKTNSNKEKDVNNLWLLL